jgi:pimeloyl-ACP methyl ester carboxylesterase
MRFAVAGLVAPARLDGSGRKPGILGALDFEYLPACRRSPLTKACNWRFLGTTSRKDNPMKHNAMAIHDRARIIYSALAILTIMFSMGKDVMAQTNTSTVVKNIILVHGGLVDGSGWKGVYEVLKKDGYTVAVVQNPTISLSDDVAVTKRAIAALNGPVILVGHSYGGVVITEAGNDPKVAGLVYVTAFAPDKGESAASLIKAAPPGAPVPPILPPQDGYLFLDKAKVPAAFAADVSRDVATFMADSQVPWGLEALNGAITQPAWRTKPSWFLVTTEDRMIPPDAQRAMSKRADSTVVEVKGSHAVYVSQPQAVAHLIEKAATGALLAGPVKTGRGVLAPH